MDFQSRKNKVILNKNGNIEKTFASIKALETEISMLKLLNGNYAPSFIQKLSTNTIEMSYVKGTLLLDLYLKSDINTAKELAIILSKTINHIYFLTNKITFDENFRNYIITPNFDCVRIDFEESTDGTIESYIAKIMAFASLYDTSVDVKTTFISALANNLKPNSKILINEYKKELTFLANRWNTNFPSNLYNLIITKAI